MLIATGTPRYTPVYSPGAKVHVLWDHALGAFCSLPGPTGEPELLTFDHSYWTLKWLMQCQKGGLDLTMPEATAPVPCPEPVY